MLWLQNAQWLLKIDLFSNISSIRGSYYKLQKLLLCDSVSVYLLKMFPVFVIIKISCSLFQRSWLTLDYLVAYEFWEFGGIFASLFLISTIRFPECMANVILVCEKFHNNVAKEFSPSPLFIILIIKIWSL